MDEVFGATLRKSANLRGGEGREVLQESTRVRDNTALLGSAKQGNPTTSVELSGECQR